VSQLGAAPAAPDEAAATADDAPGGAATLPAPSPDPEPGEAQPGA
jgi:hypothetical protein